MRSSKSKRSLILAACLILLAARQTSWLSPIHEAGRQRAENKATDVSLLEQAAQSKRIVSRGHEYQEIRFKPETEVSSAEFFSRYAKDLKIGTEDRFVQTFSRPNNLIPDQPRIVIRYQQRYKDLPVLGTSYILQTDEGDRVLAASGKFVANLNLNTTPTLSEAEALEAAKRAVPAKVYSWDQDPKKYPKGTLAVGFKDFKMTPANARLVYVFTISSEEPRQSYTVAVDANTKEILSKISNFIPDVSPAWNEDYPDCFFTTNSGHKGEASCDRGVDGKFRLMCQPDDQQSSCRTPVKTIDARRPNPQAQGQEDPDQDYVFVDNNDQTPPYFGEESVSGEMEDRAGASGYGSLRLALGYFDKVFGWDGTDGQGAVPILVYVRPIAESNTWGYYERGTNSITIDPNKVSQNEWDTVNGMGHEFAHGFTDYAANINYAGETAALSESFSDIFGCLVTNFLGLACESIEDPNSRGWPDTYQGYYYSGTADCGPALSCYQTPDKTVACDESNFNCDPNHRNGAVQSFMFHLLAKGGEGTNDPPSNQAYRVKGIGFPKAQYIAYQTVLARLSPTSTYPEARDAWVAAAEDLHGENSQEARSVKDAWNAVGIGGADDSSVSRSPAADAQDVPPWPATFTWSDKLPAELSRQLQVFSASAEGAADYELLKKIADTHPASSLTIPQTGSEEGSPATPTDGKLQVSGILMTSTANFNLRPDTEYNWRVRTSKPPQPSSSVKESGVQGVIGKVKSWFSSDEDKKPADLEWDEWGPLSKFTTKRMAPALFSPKEAGPPARGEEVQLSTKAYPWGTEFKWGSVEGGKKYLLKLSETSEGAPGVDEGSQPASGGSQPTLPGKGISEDNPVVSDLVDPFIGIWIDPKEASHQDGSGVKTTILPPLKVSHTYYWAVQSSGPKDLEGKTIIGNWSKNGQWQIFETLSPQTLLESPANGDLVSPWDIPFHWQETKGAVAYRLKLSKDLACVSDPNCTDNLYTGEDPKATSQTISLPIEDPSPAYYWSITPEGPPPWNDFGTVSEPRGFRLSPEATKPELVYPADKSYIPYKDDKAWFEWKPVPGAVQYVFNVFKKNSDGSQGASVYSTTVTADPTNTEWVIVKPGTTVTTDKAGYFWQVQAIGPNSYPGQPSEVRSYGIGPDRPVMISPAYLASGIDYHNATFTWDSEWAPNGYSLEILGVGTYAVSGKLFSITLKPNTTYSWRVSAVGLVSGQDSASGYLWNFTTKGCATSLPAPQITYPPQQNTDLGGTCTTGAAYPISWQWTDVPGKVQYEFYVKEQGGSEVSHQFITTRNLSDPVHLIAGKSYVSWVKAQDADGCWTASQNYNISLYCH